MAQHHPRFTLQSSYRCFAQHPIKSTVFGIGPPPSPEFSTAKANVAKGPDHSAWTGVACKLDTPAAPARLFPRTS
ncbi:hypothetical protein PDE_07000 [Penicillium oxalicum 114-2]|uniref:Uncharacterized protein n=1 Tax=Penicillium oxalicum (strain 114-2 / CGMCC 5302) TaxID=933388 RepID=S7ZTF0_PENO1|nr:hypothetical protein PDE_07000 [Penicillium oxalicum 114-2]